MSSFPPTLRLAAPRGCMGIQGCALVPGQVLHPGFWKGWWLCPWMCMGDEVFRVARAARNTLWEFCALWKARTPLKSIRTCCRTVRPAVASGWPRGCRGRRVRGHRECPVPRGCQWVSSQAGGSTQRLEHGGAAWGQLGIWGWKVWGQSSRVFSRESAGVGGHACASLLTCVQPCMALSFPWSLLQGGKDSGS